MTTIILAKKNGGKTYNSHLALTKGAPEVLKSLIVSPPDNYDATYRHYVQNGYRVLTLAYKVLKPSRGEKELTTMSRANAESDLTFCGFLIFECPIKPDSKAVIKEMKESGH